jgi:hypothetical protein
MVLENISAQQYANDISEAINDRDRELDTRIGPINNLYITPFSRVCERQNNRLVYLSNLISLKYVDKVRIEDLDEFLYNEGMVRWVGARAVTTVTFSRAQPPSTDILVPVNMPLATPTDPQTGQSVVFRTVETKTMYAAAASSYYNADTERYELEVSVASVATGENVDVGAYSITVMRRPISGFDEVFNKYATNSGKGLETNSEAATRYLLHVKGSQLSTSAGVERALVDNFSAVEDVYVVFGTNEYLTRERDDAGAVDVWIKGSTPVETSYTVAYPGIDTLIPVDKQPLIEVVTVFDGVTYYTEGTDFEVVTGETEYSYSNLGTDGIKFITGGTVPTIGDSLVITYRYNSLINILAAYYTQPEYYTMGMDKLFRWAQPKYLEIDVSLTVDAGNPDTIANNVRNAIQTYVNGLDLGEDVEEFDLDREVGKLFGVDNLVWNQLSIQGGTGVSDIEVSPQEYGFIETGSLNVTLV